MPVVPALERRAAESRAWLTALISITDTALRTEGERNEIMENAVVVLAADIERAGEPGASAYRRAVVKLLWLVVLEVRSAGLDRDLAATAQMRGADMRSVLDIAMQTRTLPLFIKAMNYPDDEPPALASIIEATVLALRWLLGQKPYGEKWALIAKLIAEVGM